MNSLITSFVNGIERIVLPCSLTFFITILWLMASSKFSSNYFWSWRSISSVHFSKNLKNSMLFCSRRHCAKRYRTSLNIRWHSSRYLLLSICERLGYHLQRVLSFFFLPIHSRNLIEDQLTLQWLRMRVMNEAKVVVHQHLLWKKYWKIAVVETCYKFHLKF